MPPANTNTHVDKSGIAVTPTDCKILSSSVYLCESHRVHGMVVSLTVAAGGSSTFAIFSEYSPANCDSLT